MKKSLAIILLSMILLSLASCRLLGGFFGINSPAVSVGNSYLTREECLYISLECRKLFEDSYGELVGNDFWKIEVGDGETEEDFIKENYLLPELEALTRLKDYAARKNISLTREEENQIEEEADEIWNRLSDSEKDYFGGSLKTVRSVKKLYQLAENITDMLLPDKTAEVSEEEARVADFFVLGTKTEETAKEALIRIQKGESFQSVTNNLTDLKRTKYSLSRKDIPESLSVIFSLKTGEMSEILTYNGRYYLFYVENSYNPVLSAQNRKNAVSEKRYRIWNRAVEEEFGKSEVAVDRNFWDSLHMMP